MKTNLNKLGTVLILGLFAISARATILLQDNFDLYSDGQLTNAPGGKWALVSRGSGGTMDVVSHQVAIGQTKSEDDNSALSVSNSSVNITNILYVSYTVNYSILPTGNNGDYFTHFSGPSGFKARIFGLTNQAAAGKFRIGIANGGTSPTNFQTDLNLSTTHTVVARLLLNNGSGNAISTLWVDPASESSYSVTAVDVTSSAGIYAYGFRQPGSTTPGTTTFMLDNLLVGTTFADVMPGSVNPPTVLLQPQDVTAFSGGSANFTNLAAGDATLGYQWYSVTNGVTNSIPGATGITLSLTGLATNQTGLYFAMVTNSAGTNFTRSAVLTVSPQPIPPTIDTNTFPIASTVTAGDTVTFKVAAHGLPIPAYQWQFVPATNNLVTNVVAGATSDTLTLTTVNTNQSGSYFVTITNASPVGYNLTNSAKALLTVNPPPVLSISDLRAKQDPTTWAPTNTTALFTIQGIVTTWANLTTSGNSEFYIQDSSGGIAVFWSGAAASTNLPPAGALVRVTGPLAAFSGLLEIEPVFTNALTSVVVLSTNNPLPAAQPLPFDSNVVNVPAMMEKLEGSYFVASNVMLYLNTPKFVSSANDPTTNLAYHVRSDVSGSYNFTFTNDVGQTFILFVNSHTDIPNQVKPTGPVTVYGVLGQFVSASPYVGGYEFTPTRFADIISYFNQSNVVSHVVRAGDLQTNSYTESKLMTGETLTTYLRIGDPEGGTVTLAPADDGLPASASWSGVTDGQTATAVFHFTPTAGDTGSNYVVGVGVSSTSGNSFSNVFTVYVPTADEQQIAISEFLANPTTNAVAANFNPLKRSSDTVGVSTNDQYIEIASQSPNDTYLLGWTLYNSTGTKVEDFSLYGPTLASSNAVVVYGGPSDLSAPPNLAAYNEPATSKSLSLAKTGTGTIVLRNQNGNLIDRVVYSGSDLNTNGSLARFPDNINGPFVPQPYVSTNANTAGLPYDGGAWNQPFKVPAGVNSVGVSVVNGQVLFSFAANPGLASTLWGADAVTGPFKVLTGQQFPTGSGVFTNTVSGPQKFYFISTQ